MSIKSLYPDTRPSLNLDFANTKVLDPRITFTRASTATYYDGKTVSKAEENLITNSQNFSGSNWTPVNGSIVNNAAVAPDGTNTAGQFVVDLTSGTHYLQGTFTIPFPSVPSYTVSFYIKQNGYQYIYSRLGIVGDKGAIFNLSAGTVYLTSSATTANIQSVGNGWYRCSYTASSNQYTNAELYIFPSDNLNASVGTNPQVAGNGVSGFYVWGCQCEIRSSLTAYTPTTTQPITKYQPTLLTAPVNTPRFDHNPTTGESLGLLIEGPRTNLILRSQEFSQSNWLNGNLTASSVLVNQMVAPDGTLSADQVTGSGYLRQAVSGTTGVHTISIYAKAGTNNTIRLNRYDGTNDEGATFVLTGNGSITNSYGPPDSTTITHVGNGWYRCTLTSTNVGNTDFQIHRDGTGTAFIWGAQLEAGSFATSYIPTSGSQVTRGAEGAGILGTNFNSFFRNDEGTLYTEQVINNLDYFLANQSPASLYKDIQNFITIGQGVGTGGTSGNTASAWVSSENVAQCILTTPQFLNVGNTLKCCFGYSVNDFAFSANQQSILTDNFGVIPSGLTHLSIGSGYPNYYIHGWIKKISYYPKRLTNTQLQALTQP